MFPEHWRAWDLHRLCIKKSRLQALDRGTRKRLCLGPRCSLFRVRFHYLAQNSPNNLVQEGAIYIYIYIYIFVYLFIYFVWGGFLFCEIPM